VDPPNVAHAETVHHATSAQHDQVLNHDGSEIDGDRSNGALPPTGPTTRSAHEQPHGSDTRAAAVETPEAVNNHVGSTAISGAFNPGNLEFIVVSFEGPDQPYSMAGGLGVRVTELTQALAEAGFQTHLIFVGDPNLPGHEVQHDGRLHLHRWSQWISRNHPNGVYDGENLKVRDLNDSVPRFVAGSIVAPAARNGRTVAILAEEWHTAETTWRISDLLHVAGLRHHALLLWNANNTYAFTGIDWTRLQFVSTITTVSRYMKHAMWPIGLNPLVIPNGIPHRFLEAPRSELVDGIARGIGASPFLFKIGRFDPDKRWMQAIEATLRLKRLGQNVKLAVRGGIEPHGGQVLAHAYRRGLVIRDVTAPRNDDWAAIHAISEAAREADILNLRFFISDDLKRALYASADAVLANSGHEPFGLVGLEVMGAGGVAVVGATGEDYAISLQNCISIETDDAEELAGAIRHLMAHPEWLGPIREEARRTANLFTWNRVIGNLLGKLEYLAARPNGS
jgi:glycosyltransferase involved in cell wall biosynthesis